MKKVFAIIAVMGVMLTFFAACGKKKSDIDFEGGNQSTIFAPNGSNSGTSSISSEDKELDDAWGNVSVGIGADQTSSKKPTTSSSSSTTSSKSSHGQIYLWCFFIQSLSEL